MDAVEAGFEVTVIEGLCRYVAPDTSAKEVIEAWDESCEK